MTYVIVLILFAILNQCYTNKNVNLKNKKNFCIGVSVIIVLLLVLRNDYVGTDTQNYHFIYDNILNPGYFIEFDDARISSEIGFHGLLYGLQTLHMDFRLLLVLSAIIYISAVSMIVYKYSERPFFSYFLFFVNGFFIFNTTMRHCFALSFIIFAVYFAINRKVIPYLIFTILAVLFHSSAIIMAPIYWLLNLKLNKRLFILLALCFIIMIIVSKSLMPYVESFFGKKYDIMDTGGEFRIILNFIIAVFGVLYARKMSDSNKVWILFLLFSIVLAPIAKLNPAFFRINIYFTFFSILLIPNLSKIKNQIIQLLIIIIVCFGLFNFTYLTNKAGIRVFPYVFYWENYFEENPAAKRLDLM